MMRNQFFKEQKMTASEIKELVHSMTLEHFKPFQHVFEHGSIGTKFYMILQGSVSVTIPNPKIREWQIKQQEFKQLLEWKDR